MKRNAPVRKPCFLCKVRTAKPLSAKCDRGIYVHAQDVTVFCSLRCAANYALIWCATEMEYAHHFCTATGEWECIEKTGCDACQNGSWIKDKIHDAAF